MDTSGFGDRMGAKIKAMDAQVREASAHLERVEYLLEEESVDPESLRAVRLLAFESKRSRRPAPRCGERRCVSP